MMRGARRAAVVAMMLLIAMTTPRGEQVRQGTAPSQPAAKAPQAPLPRLDRTTEIPLALFTVPEGFEVTLWAGADMVRNPTNIDVDRDGRIWVAEGVRYRKHHARQPAGDRIVVLEDTNGDGRADASHTFVQEPALVAPLGVAVIDNRIVVSQPPDLIVYTDVDRNQRFDPAVDRREVLLTGFQGINHDHSLHSVTVGPDGKWLFNSGNMGARFTDRSGRTFTSIGPYRADPIGPWTWPHDAAKWAGTRSDDGHVYVGGFMARMNPDGTQVEIIGHNFRNSYEQSITSLGDVFQSDNDDPPACRVSWVMEYANFGFASNDGQRTWQADRRPWQSVPMAEWRQDDPGSTPAGDIYGGGSPTGTAFYENGALGEAWRGTFFAAEPGRNAIFAYQPVRDGAGFRLERRDFLTSNREERYAGTDFSGGPGTTTAEIATLFRPSDIAVGADGALYVSDWIDPIVGFHEDLDDAVSGAIYRIAPKAFAARTPALDTASIDGLVSALRSPAVNVRAIGFEGLQARGAAVVPAVAALLDDSNVYIRSRALFLLYQLGPEGRAKAGAPDAYADASLRIAAYRAMRRAGEDITPIAARLARDTDAGVRRDVALSMRDRAAELALPILADVARRFDGLDRSYLEALGTGATHKEAALYDLLRREMGTGDPRAWSDAFAWIAWRLHPPTSVDAFARRAAAAALPIDARRRAMDALAFVHTRAAATEMVELAASEGPLKESATWWVLNRTSNDWADHDLLPTLKRRGIFDPDTVRLQSVIVPPRDTAVPVVSLADVTSRTGDPARGKDGFARCMMCHAMGGVGAEVGPALDGWTRGKSLPVIAAAIIDPDAGIAHGYAGTTIRTTDGLTIQGLLIKEGDPLMVRSMGNVTQVIPASRVKARERLTRSLMMDAAQLGMSAQDVADVIAFLKAH
ncbi:putative membrane-bound dehydrogenase domain protein [Luteitalea pratensis]|uniref:Putative membrane-bound dehydrogenase domain protein n=1 Tax=Luteitalea pratensis TaxID=1855912 RepID=A0A143PXA0_LUTPR|nr:PVC-type heme-binding CxxCH protein [Luteitalea pratensis]AMY12419.1 putative membrane-bound dehydrogenase domain protein [Luteitalea pratensis]